MLRTKIQEDLIQSLKAKNQERVEALRMLLAEIKNKEIDTKEELNDDEVTKIVRSNNKKLKEALEMFEKGGRADLAEQNRAHIAIYNEYLPQELGEDEVRARIAKIKEDNAAIIEQNPKALIGMAMKELSSQADPQLVMKLLNE